MRILMRLVAACLTLVGCGVSVTAGGGATPQVVTSSDMLARAIASGRPGDVIRVAAGRYGPLSLGKELGGSGLTIEAAVAAAPPVFPSITISGIDHVTLRGLKVERAAGAELIDYIVAVARSQAVTIENLQIAAPGEAERGRQYGIFVRDSRGVRIAGSRLSGTRYGIGLLDDQQIVIERNELRGLQTDGIRGGGLTDVVIAENVLGEFGPKPKEHPDGIQIWTANTTAPARRILIRDNLIARGAGGATQGIFVRDNKLQLPFEQLEIRGNLVVGSLYHGITVEGATRPAITDNEVIAYADQKSWIRTVHCTDPQLERNRASIFLMGTERHDGFGSNRSNRIEGGSAAPRIRAWLERGPLANAPATSFAWVLAGSGAS